MRKPATRPEARGTCGARGTPATIAPAYWRLLQEQHRAGARAPARGPAPRPPTPHTHPRARCLTELLRSGTFRDCPRSALRSPSIWRIPNARGCANFIRWSSSLRGQHRTMAANPVIKLRGNRAHTETTVLGQLKKKAEPRYSLRQLPDHCQFFCDGPAEFTESAHRVCGSTPIRSDQP
jgi:hypothetical protein